MRVVAHEAAPKMAKNPRVVARGSGTGVFLYCPVDRAL
jgi:hypothetical protein